MIFVLTKSPGWEAKELMFTGMFVLVFELGKDLPLGFWLPVKQRKDNIIEFLIRSISVYTLAQRKGRWEQLIWFIKGSCPSLAA